jgi:hypothetical protein
MIKQGQQIPILIGSSSSEAARKAEFSVLSFIHKLYITVIVLFRDK